VNCDDFEKYVSAFVDGEVDPATSRDLETHRAACSRCAVALDEERTVKRAVHAGARRVTAPADLRERIRSSLDHVDASAPPRAPATVRRWAPFAAAAAIAAGLALWLPARIGPHTSEAGLFDIGTHLHAKNLPAEFASANADLVSNWYAGKVDIKVRPPRFKQRGRLIGARLVQIGDRDAAQLFYLLNGRRVSILIWAGESTPDEGTSIRVRDRHFRVRTAKGFTGAHTRRGDLDYMLVSDFGPSETARLAGQLDW